MTHPHYVINYKYHIMLERSKKIQHTSHNVPVQQIAVEKKAILVTLWWVLYNINRVVCWKGNSLLLYLSHYWFLAFYSIELHYIQRGLLVLSLFQELFGDEGVSCFPPTLSFLLLLISQRTVKHSSILIRNFTLWNVNLTPSLKIEIFQQHITSTFTNNPLQTVEL